MRSAASLALIATLLSAAGPAFAAETVTSSPSEQSSIEYVISRGMLTPMSDGQFHPEQAISRIDIVTSVVRDVYASDIRSDCFDRVAPAIPARFTNLFTDVSRTAVRAKELCVGMFVGIVDGRPNGSFGPLGSANLVEAAKIVTKAYGIAPKPGLRLQSGIPWHEPYWYALAKRGAIPESVKSRNAALTRGEFAEILFRLRNERPAQGFKYVPGQLQNEAQEATIASTVVESASVMTDDPFSEVPVPSPAEAPIPTMSAGITLQMHVEERRMLRMGTGEPPTGVL